uniref:Uncharacterized protein n=1 Tax=Phlebotomus papatasi TaxID=29031 RepID=A0A1B0DRK3_PHLPP
MLIGEFEKYELSILAVQEIRWPDKGMRNTKNGHVLYYCGSQNNQHHFGTGFLIHKKLKTSIIGFTPISDRMCSIRIRGRFHNITIFSVHAPTLDKSDDIKEEFYAKLEEEYDKVPKYDVKLILGDFNAKIGREESLKPAIGNHSLHENTNDNGYRLVDFATGRGAVISSTFYPHKRVHLGTWHSPDGATINQIDHVVCDARHCREVLDVRSYRGADVCTDHFLLRIKYRAKIVAELTKEKSHVSQWNIGALKQENIKTAFEQEMERQLIQTSFEEGGCVEEKWQNIKSVVTQVADKKLGKPTKKKRSEWYDFECERIVKEQNEARLKLLQRRTRQNEKEYKNKRKEAHKLLRRKKRAFQKKQIEDIETTGRNKSEMRSFYKQIKMQRGNYQPRPLTCRDVDGRIISEKHKCMNRWAKYFEELLNVHVEVEESREDFEEEDCVEIEEPHIDEVRNAISRLKNNKAPGEDGIPSELYKEGGEVLTQAIHDLVKEIWRQETLPVEWKKGIICPIFKKGDKLNCNNYRGISLLNTGYKILSNIIYHRLIPFAEKTIGDYQCGFRPGRSTIDQIFTLRQILEKCTEQSIDTHHLFIDFKQAYDSVNRKKLWAAMKIFSVPNKLIRMARLSVHDSSCCVRMGSESTADFKVCSGLRQGDQISPLLFNFALEVVIREVTINPRGSIYNRSVQILAYADDIDLIGRTTSHVQKAYAELETAASVMGLSVSESKTKYMVVSKKNRRQDQIACGNRKFDRVDDFKYLGSSVNSTNAMSSEIAARVLQGNRAFFSLLHLFKSRSLSTKTKIRLYKTLVRPVITYACETWTLTKADERKLAAFERKILRKIYGPVEESPGVWRIRWNEEIYSLYKDEKIVNVVKSMRLQWVGHVLRMEPNLPARRALDGNPPGKRTVGRPKTRWISQVEGDLDKLKGKKLEEVDGRPDGVEASCE